MNRLDKPNISVKNVFKDCISNFRDDEFRNRLENCVEDIVRFTQEYEEKMNDGQVHTIPIHKMINNITKDEMVKVYEQKMAKKGQPGRKYYDQIMSIPKHGICPYCGEGVVSTLDHYLPKSKYVSLIVTPSNLIPSCFDCNKTKTDDDFEKFTDVTINPYFDNIGDEIWLKANISFQDDDFIIKYEVNKPDTWRDDLFTRVKTHFRIYKLNKLYSSKAAQKMVGIKRKMIKQYDKCGIDGVMEYFKDGLDEYSYNLNSWQSALYRGLIENSEIEQEWLELHRE